MMRKIIFSAFLLLSLLNIQLLRAQQPQLELFSVDTDSRSAAMGMGGNLLVKNNFLYTDPASILYEDLDYSFHLRASTVPSAVNSYSRALYGLSASWRFSPVSALAAGFRYLDSKTFSLSGTRRLAQQYSSEAALDLSYAHGFSAHFSCFLKFSLLRSQMEDTFLAAATSLGLNYRTDLSLSYIPANFGLNLGLENLGRLKNLAKNKLYTIPSTLSASSALKLEPFVAHRLTFVAGLRHFLTSNPKRDLELGIGAEYIFQDLIAFRGGYKFLGRGTQCYGLGIGLVLNKFHIDYALCQSRWSRDIYYHSFGLSYGF